MEFHKKLLYVRAKLNLSQGELANKLNVSFATVSRWENNKSIPTKKAQMVFDQFCHKEGITFEEERQ